jgi:hypothetical protein
MKLTALIDRLEVIKEVLKERENAATPSLVEALDAAIGLVAEMIKTEKIVTDWQQGLTMNPNDFMKQFINDMEFMFGEKDPRKRRRR